MLTSIKAKIKVNVFRNIIYTFDVPFGTSYIKMTAEKVKEGIDAIYPFIANLENS